MEFRTPFKQKLSMPEISYHSSLLLLGSCFSDVMANKLIEAKFQTVSNPFGVIFNTSSLRFWFEQLVQRRPISVRELEQVNDYFVHFQAHSCFNAPDAALVVDQLQEAYRLFQASVSSATHIFITLGTAWVYVRLETQQIVANCHKAPQAHFRKVLQSTESIREDLQHIKSVIQTINPKAKLIFTVSPVRHLKDGMVENQRSKARLITALHDYLDTQNQDFYFPSYELLLDDLRDYRFYDRDMLHPNDLAVDYIWDRFKAYFFDTETLFWNAKILAVQRDLQHRPKNKKDNQFALHRAQILKKIDEIKQKWTEISFVVD